jgi:hypothetical protein
VEWVDVSTQLPFIRLPCDIETELGTSIFPGMPLVGSEDNLDVDGEVKFAYWEGVRSVSSGRKRSAVSIESVRETVRIPWTLFLRYMAWRVRNRRMLLCEGMQDGRIVVRWR